MRNATRVLLVGLAAFSVLQFAACRQQVQIPAEFQLDDLGTFQVEAGVPTQNRGTGSLGDNPIDIGSGTMLLDPASITFTPADGGGSKGSINQQDGGEELVVTAWIAAVDEVDTVCETGEEYGPFTVTLDEDNQPTTVDPDSVTLTQTTIDLINGGEFSLCIEVVSTLDGTVTIEVLDFTLGL